MNTQLLAIANEFINTLPKKYKAGSIVTQIHKDLQVEVHSLYEEIKSAIDFSTEQGIVDSVAKLTVISDSSKDNSSVTRMFPKYYRKYPGKGMECTLSSGILKLALEEKKYKKVHTVLLSGHQIACRRHESDAISLYDPSTTWTGVDGITHGYYHRFNATKIVYRKEVQDRYGIFRGIKFRIETKRKPGNTGMFDAYEEHKKVYHRDFFASEPSTLIELSVVLHNLSGLSDRRLFSSLREFDADLTIKQSEIFDHKTIFR